MYLVGEMIPGDFIFFKWNFALVAVGISSDPTCAYVSSFIKSNRGDCDRWDYNYASLRTMR